MINPILFNVLNAIGICLIVAGVALVSIPAALVVAGILVILLTYLSVLLALKIRAA